MLCSTVPWPAKKKKVDKEAETQTLQLPKELPNAVVGETRRLTFYVTPLSAKGLLSQQVRDGLKALDRQDGDDTVLQIRAFVAGSGDLRRVRDLISETFVEHRQPLILGGTNWPDNLCLACVRCNLRKGTKTEAEFLAYLLKYGK